MMGRTLAACARKEALLLVRDKQTLLLLFLMPTAFILIMSLALQERFEPEGQGRGLVLVIDQDGGVGARELVASLREQAGFEVEVADGGEPADVRRRVRDGDLDFAVTIGEGLSASLASRSAQPSDHLHILAAPAVEGEREAQLTGALELTLARLRLRRIAQRLEPPGELGPEARAGGLRVEYLYGEGENGVRPSSVQQNVPAWLVFGIFFVVIPLSNTMIRERQSGMEQRLRTTPAGPVAILAGKLLPYFVVNQLQSVAMLAVGVFVVPALGGEALSLNGVPLAALAVMAIAVSLAALGYALLVASASETTEQAGMLGGGGNIILAAIGGIMVPEFIMPARLQAVADVSPMAWGLDGFLTAFLQHGGIAAIAPHAAALAAFGAAGTGIAAWLQARRAA